MKKTLLAVVCAFLFAGFAGNGFCVSKTSLCAQSGQVNKEELKTEKLEFYYAGKVFEYDLGKNIKQSSVFSENLLLNKYNRFGSVHERQTLLNTMLKAGFSYEVAVNYLFPNLNKVVLKLEKNINTKPKDATISVNNLEEKVFSITKETIGINVDKQQLYRQICANYLQNKPLTFVVPTISTTPKVLASDYKKYTNLRADFSTDFSSSSADRKHNIKNALNSLNGVEIMPGQLLSFNKVVGRRDASNGYRTAKIIVNNQFVDGVGGGVCQVSTTLYNAALLAGLDVVEANKHSKQVGYVKYGFDAMVNFGTSDLKIKNNTAEKIVIITNYKNNKARVRIFGQGMNGVKYELKNNILNVVQPQEEVVIDYAGEYADKVKFEDESFILQPAQRGMEVESYRVKIVNGVQESKQLLRKDKFKPQNCIKVFGAKKREVCLPNFLVQTSN